MSSDRAIVLLAKAYLELNAIRARDGAPAGVSHEYFSELVDAIDECVKSQTGQTAHCHPFLYRYALVERSVEADAAAYHKLLAAIVGESNRLRAAIRADKYGRNRGLRNMDVHRRNGLFAICEAAGIDLDAELKREVLEVGDE